MHRGLFQPKSVIVQGITGSHGRFHTAAMLSAGTPIIAGTSPGKAGQFVSGIPVYNTIADIKSDHPIDASVIFVPAVHAKAALLEAISAAIPLIVCITEGVPIHDMLEVKQQAISVGVTILGPNCPGFLLPGINKLGIIPAQLALPGAIGIVSRSGTLTYEITASLSAHRLGQKYIIGIGGDPIRGTDFTDCLQVFESDPGVKKIVLIGEVGGDSEHRAAEFIRQCISKPVFAYVAGHSAPPNVQLGHAGAILNKDSESAASKIAALQKAGAITATNLNELIKKIA